MYQFYTKIQKVSFCTSPKKGKMRITNTNVCATDFEKKYSEDEEFAPHGVRVAFTDENDNNFVIYANNISLVRIEESEEREYEVLIELDGIEYTLYIIFDESNELLDARLYLGDLETYTNLDFVSIEKWTEKDNNN